MSKINWIEIRNLLEGVFGQDNVESDGQAITIHFDVAKPRDLQLSNLLMSQLSQAKDCFYSTNITQEEVDKSVLLLPNDTSISLVIYKESSTEKLWEALRPFQHMSARKDGSEVRLHADPEDIKMYHLEQLTGKSWQQVIHGPYNEPVLQAVSDCSLTNEQRASQEIALAEVAIERPHAKMKGWIEKQQEVEAQKNITPCTAIPVNMANSDRNFWPAVADGAYTKRVRTKVRTAFR